MQACDVDSDLELLMRHWHVTADFATAARADYEALRATLPASDTRVSNAHARWRSAERERRELIREIEATEEAAA